MNELDTIGPNFHTDFSNPITSHESKVEVQRFLFGLRYEQINDSTKIKNKS